MNSWQLAKASAHLVRGEICRGQRLAEVGQGANEFVELAVGVVPGAPQILCVSTASVRLRVGQWPVDRAGHLKLILTLPLTMHKSWR